MKPDNHGIDGKYALSSLYFDSPDRKFYWEKIEGIKFRRKLRIRRYVGVEAFAGDSPVFLEIKQRVNKVTQKRRLKLKYAEAMAFCVNGVVPVYKKCDQDLIEEIDTMLRMYELEPTVITSYDREAFDGDDYDLGLRVTFDTDISYSYKNLDLTKNPHEGHMVSPDMVIMEIKVNERIPYWITELVSKHNFRLIRVSKYCQGLETSDAVPLSFYHI
jgi:SPX domain protein involved in polyphosphate accumulation